MIYLSKGILCHSSAKYGVQIAHGNQKYHLTDTEAALWMRGQLTFAPIYTKEEASVLHHLYEKGLAEYEQNNDNAAKYRILSRCVCCPDKMKPTGSVLQLLNLCTLPKIVSGLRLPSYRKETGRS